MFTWICPKCGREVPPSYGDCPDCTPKLPKTRSLEQVNAPAAVIAADQAKPLAPVVVPVTALPTAPSPTAIPDPTLRVPFANAPPATNGGGLPGWAIGVGSAVGLAAFFYVLFTYILPKKVETTTSARTAESAAAVPGAVGRNANPLAKFLEIVGIRWVEDAKQKTKMQFIVVNHSAADLPELKMQISVKAGSKLLFEVPFTVSSIGPYESKEFSTPIQTALKGYELPDWQFLKADFEITSQP